MKIAVMQPYFFPYMGYFQLISAVDVFVVFDDVNYIKRGWINKNRILQNGETSNITLPIQKASQNRKINQHFRTVDVKILDKLKKQIKFAYVKAPNFNNCYPLIEQIIDYPETNLAKYLTHSLKEISQYLGYNTQFIYSSALSNHDDFDSAEQRIINITKQLGGTEYYNLPGGKALYTNELFLNNGLKLQFINPKLNKYNQLNTNSFQSDLSVLDFIMN